MLPIVYQPSYIYIYINLQAKLMFGLFNKLANMTLPHLTHVHLVYSPKLWTEECMQQ